MEFKKLEITPESNWVKRIIQSQHARKSVIYIIIGAIGGVLFFYFTEGKNLNVITLGDIIKSMLVGGFFGFFITNSPCARGRC